MRQRVIEDRDALSVAGKVPTDLGMLEVQYRVRQSEWLHTFFRHLPPLRLLLLRLPILRSALYEMPPPDAEQIADAILRAAPQARNAWVPAGIGCHADHLLVRQAGAVLASRGLRVRMFADMPYSVRHGWPAWVGQTHGKRRRDRASAFWARQVGVLSPSDVIDKAIVVRLSPQECTRKIDAIHRYTTQVGSLSTGRRRGWLNACSLAYEIYWELEAPEGAARRMP
jgi:LmbE family N-acetylglucosaminyl deacetylase